MRPYLYPYTCITGPTLRVLQELYLQVQRTLKKSYEFSRHSLQIRDGRKAKESIDATQNIRPCQREEYCDPRMGLDL